jgi:hypothetical protein
MKRLKSKLVCLFHGSMRFDSSRLLLDGNVVSHIENQLYISREKGRVVGGTKGNFILEYVSGAPNKQRVIDRVPNVFDYDELTKYGFSVSKAILVLCVPSLLVCTVVPT